MSILVVGAGIMGRGIAYVAAHAQRDVVLVDADPEALRAAPALIARLAERAHDDPQAIAARIVTQPSVAAAVQHARPDFAIEAVSENIAVKARVFQDLARLTPASTVLATNTSSIPVTRIADSVEPKHRVIGMHFFNPVPVMRGLEVIRTEYTDQAVIDRTVALGKQLGKQVSLCRVDIAGFIVNRVLVAMMLEATNLLERGAASVPEIDRIMKHAAGMPMGPFRLADLVGLDTIVALMQIIYDDSGRDPRYKPSPTVQKLVSDGKLGSKNGEGFYVYNRGKL